MITPVLTTAFNALLDETLEDASTPTQRLRCLRNVQRTAANSYNGFLANTAARAFAAFSELYRDKAAWREFENEIIDGLSGKHKPKRPTNEVECFELTARFIFEPTQGENRSRDTANGLSMLYVAGLSPDEVCRKITEFGIDDIIRLAASLLPRKGRTSAERVKARDTFKEDVKEKGFEGATEKVWGKSPGKNKLRGEEPPEADEPDDDDAEDADEAVDEAGDADDDDGSSSDPDDTPNASRPRKAPRREPIDWTRTLAVNTTREQLTLVRNLTPGNTLNVMVRATKSNEHGWVTVEAIKLFGLRKRQM